MTVGVTDWLRKKMLAVPIGRTERGRVSQLVGKNCKDTVCKFWPYKPNNEYELVNPHYNNQLQRLMTVV